MTIAMRVGQRLSDLFRKSEGIRRRAFGISVFVLAVTLAGCWIPEQFDARVTVNADGSYSYTYDGILTFAPALADAARGVLDARTDAEVGKFAAELRREGFRKADYQGKGRFAVAIERAGRKGQPSHFLSKDMMIFFVEPQSDGSLMIGALRPDANALRQFSEIGGKIEGTLSVSVARGVKVLKHNAQSEPSLFGYLGSYKWQIKSPDANPFIVVRPNG